VPLDRSDGTGCGTTSFGDGIGEHICDTFAAAILRLDLWLAAYDIGVQIWYSKYSEPCEHSIWQHQVRHFQVSTTIWDSCIESYKYEQGGAEG
jgi:hypothetical protein